MDGKGAFIVENVEFGLVSDCLQLNVDASEGFHYTGVLSQFHWGGEFSIGFVNVSNGHIYHTIITFLFLSPITQSSISCLRTQHRHVGRYHVCFKFSSILYILSRVSSGIKALLFWIMRPLSVTLKGADVYE